MGLVTKKDTSFRLDESVSAFFDMPSLEEEEKNYDELKIDINKLDIDIEEKANIINKINKLNFTTSPKEKKKINEEIKEFKNKYNL